MEAEKFFQEQQEKYGFIGDVRFYCLNGGSDIVKPQTQAPDAMTTAKLIYRLFELGFLIISLRGYTLRFQPPLVITEEQLQEVFTKFEQAFNQLASGQLQLPPNADQIGW